MTRVGGCRGCRMAAFALSALLHLGIGAAAFGLAATLSENGDDGDTEPVAVTLGMFTDGPDVADAAENADSATAKTVEAAPALQPPVPAPKPADPIAAQPAAPAASSVSKPAPVATVKPSSGPETPSKPAPKAKPKSAPKPKPKPVARPNPKSKTEIPAKTERDAATGRDGSGKPSASAGRRGASGRTKSGGAITGGRSATAAKAAAESRYLRELQQAIARRRYYPKLAQRRGLEGTANVQFTIAADGSFSAIHVSGSSGSEELDKAAVQTLQRLARFKPIPSAIGRSSWTVRVPIVYRIR